MPAPKTVVRSATSHVPHLVAAMLLSIAVIGIARAEDLRSPLAKLDLKDGDGIVFYGDSITHQRLYTQYLEDYFYTRFPTKRLRLHNAGVSGSVAWEAIERFEGDVAAYKPKYVMLLLGMNDGNHEPFNPSIFATFRRDMTTILQKIQKIGATPIVLTPTMFDARVRRAIRPDADADSTSLYNAVLAYYGAWLREVATEQGFAFVDVWAPMNNMVQEQRKSDPKFTLVPDSVHPGPAGQVVMAKAIIHDLGLPQQVSSIKIALAANSPSQVDATGGKLTDLRCRDDGVEFTWQAESLPWVLPDDAQVGARLADLGHCLSRESFEIDGLAPGKYTLTIDGQEVGTYDNVAIEHGVELQENAKTPQHQQALVVAQLNKQRNEGPINALRDEWWSFQDYVDAKREADEHPDSGECKASLGVAQQKIAGMDQRIAKDDAEAKAIEDKIFDLNKPPARKYTLVRITTPSSQVGR